MQCSNHIYLGASKEASSFDKYVKLGGCSNPICHYIVYILIYPPYICHLSI